MIKMQKYKKITFISVCIIIALFAVYLIFHKKDTTEPLKIYYAYEYITGELIYTEPMVNEVINLPIISNIEITGITIIDIIGENIDNLIIEIDHIPYQNHYYEDFVYKNIKLRIKAYEMSDEIKVDKINFEITAKNSVNQISLPFDLTIKYEKNIFNLVDFGFLKMFSVAPTLSDPNNFFTFRPSHNMKIISIFNNIPDSIENIHVGISSSDDFNEINKTVLDSYNGNELNIDLLKYYNIYFNIDYQFEEKNSLGILFPIIGKVELTNHEVYDILIMNAINLMIDHITIEKYIDNNFKEG